MNREKSKRVDDGLRELAEDLAPILQDWRETSDDPDAVVSEAAVASGIKVLRRVADEAEALLNS